MKRDQFKNGLLEKKLLLSRLKIIFIWRVSLSKGSNKNGTKVRELM